MTTHRKKATQLWEELSLCESKSQEIDILEAALGNVPRETPKKVNGTYKWQNHPLPDWMPLEAWKEWLTNRQKLKAVNSERALNSLIVKLDFCRTQGYSIEAVIDEAIMKGWKSVDADWLKTKPTSSTLLARVEYDACGNLL